jgi:chromosomal replication initiator protein
MNLWDQIKNYLASKLPSQNFENWLADTRFSRADGDTLWILVPDDAAKEWIEQEYRESIQAAIRTLNLPIRRVQYEVGFREDAPAVEAHVAAANGGGNGIGTEPAFTASGARFSAKLTFDTFVVGSCNQFAHAAAKAVASMPSRSYNPLFIYGGTGMGKTHLMNAIGRSLADNYGSMRIVYTSSERFMNEMINCIRMGRMPQFQQHYRSADVLLVDDIHTLGGKERTQEEFFHTFNELYEHEKQIVISSDSSPANIPGLVERLRSRFEWGLMVDVQPPDLETKMAILDKKAAAEGVILPEDVRILIATRTKSNVRELEGALIKLIAYSSVTGSPITLTMAQQVLKNVIHVPERKLTMDVIIRTVADRFGLQPSQLKQTSNTRQIAYPRQIAMYLIKELTHASLPEIGRMFGGKHHTTVLHSIQKIDEQRLKDQELNRLLHSLTDSLN